MFICPSWAIQYVIEDARTIVYMSVFIVLFKFDQISAIKVIFYEGNKTNFSLFRTNINYKL